MKTTKFTFVICTGIIFAFWSNVSAQLNVDETGNTNFSGNIYLESDSNIIATTNDVPITFKMGDILTGYAGNMDQNVLFGYGALLSNTTGESNTAIGHEALVSNTTGWGNTANGMWALCFNTTGLLNTAIGMDALFYETGDCNTAIGALAIVNHNLNNSTAIGYDATATSNNQIRIGNSSVTSIGGYAAWTNLSDKRTKKNIRPDVPGLAFINGLQPVTYNLDLDAIDGLLKINKTKRHGKSELPQELTDIKKKAREAKEKQIQTGFIAQDVEKTAQSIGYNFSGVDVDETGVYGLRYAEFVVPLVKAVQELSEQNDRLQEQINELTGLVYSLQGKDTGSSILKSGTVAESATELQQLTADVAFLQQNTPNPFTEQTEIRYYLPGNIQSAFVCIFNMQGTMLKKLDAPTGAHTLVVKGSELRAGMYLYALVADGKEVDTKRMILTK